MAQLEPCPSCQRHVKREEHTCPFCQADVREAFAARPARGLPRTRLGRAAIFAFGVSAVSAPLSGCARDDDDDDRQDEQSGDGDTGDGDTGDGDTGDGDTGDGDTGDGDDGNVQPVYGVPPGDGDGNGDGDQDVDAGMPTGDDGLGDAGVFPVYGAAPATAK